MKALHPTFFLQNSSIESLRELIVIVCIIIRLISFCLISMDEAYCCIQGTVLDCTDIQLLVPDYSLHWLKAQVLTKHSRPSDRILKPTAFLLELVIVALIVHSRGA